MPITNQSSRHIYLQDADSAKAEKSIYKYDMKDIKDEFEFKETMMSEFRNLGLSEDEKMVLSNHHRKIICTYKSLDNKTLKKIGNEVLNKISEQIKKKVDVRIKAQGVMAYFCLAAIYSGKLPHNKQIVFELSAIPLSLFPKSLVKKIPNPPEIIFFLEEENWISEFKTLYKCPKYMALNPSYVDCTKEHRFAT